MSRPFSPFEQVKLLAQLADHKEDIYKVILGLTALIEVLMERGLITEEELLTKSQELESELHIELPITSSSQDLRVANNEL